MSGVYKIVNNINGKMYIGSTTGTFYRRFTTHKRHLLKNKHKNQHLQFSWNKYGQDAFSFEIIEVCCEKTECFDREQFYLDTLLPEYNILKNAGTVLGYKHSVETKRKIGECTAGKSFTGNHIFYHTVHGTYIGSVMNFINKFNLKRTNGYNLINKHVQISHGWIYLGKNKRSISKDIDQIHLIKSRKNKQIHTFEHKKFGIFIGTVTELIKKYNYNRKAVSSSLYSIARHTRKSALGWKCHQIN